MVYSSLKVEKERRKPYPDSIQEALDYLKNTDFSGKEPGTYPIKGEDIYALVQEIETKPVSEKRPESHKEYIDIQYIISGEEKMGFTTDDGSYTVAEGNEEKDIYFYESARDENFVVCKDDDFCIFYPYDIHRPGVQVNGPATVRKVVVKVKVSTYA